MERIIIDREIIIKDLLEQKPEFVIKCKHPYAAHTRYVEPVRDEATKWFKGVDRITDKIKNSGEPYVDPTDENNPLASVELYHNKTFDLKNKVDYLICKWLFHCDHVLAMSLEEANANKEASFYVYNEALELKREMEMYNLIDNAVSILNSLSYDDLLTISRLMGKLWSNKSADQIRLDLRKLINLSPKEAANFISKVNDREKDIKIFILRAKDRGVIHENTKGEWYYNDIFLGGSFPSVIAWFLDVENRELANEIASVVGDVLPTKVKIKSNKDK